MGRSQVTEAVKTAYRLILTDPCRFQGCLCAGVKYIQRCTTESQNHAVLTEWARVWNSGSLVHDTTRSESRVRDGAGVSPLSQHVLQQGMKSFLKIAIQRADWLNNSGGLPITSEDITRVLSDIIRDPMFQRAVGLSTNGDKCSSIQGERTYPTRPSFNLGKDDPKKENMGPNSETSQRGPRNVYKDKGETSQSERYFLRRRNTSTHPKP